MQQPINTGNRSFCLDITIKCAGNRKFRCAVSDYGRINSKYAARIVEVNGERNIYFSLPVTPKIMTFEVFDIANKDATDFTVDVKEKPLQDYAIWLDDDSRDFLKLGIYFSQVCGFARATPDGRMFATADNRFAIKYFTVIPGQSTPARIGHKSGIMEASEAKFAGYTFAQRMMILLHEFSHKFRNPKMGLPINNEIGADINALYIYLGLGFSKVDAIYVYANVFLKAQTPGNISRMRKIMDYIQRFENQEFAQRM